MILAWIDLAPFFYWGYVAAGGLAGLYFWRVNGRLASVLIGLIFGPMGLIVCAIIPRTARKEAERQAAIELELIRIRSESLRYDRALPEKCEHCGYNLTGNTTGICPECGNAIKPTIRPVDELLDRDAEAGHVADDLEKLEFERFRSERRLAEQLASKRRAK